jgi:hypothetical protein
MSGPMFSNVNPSISYTENGAPVTLSGNLTITDSSSTTLASATISISGGRFTGDGDVLAASTVGTPNITAIYNSSTETLTLTGVDTLAHYDQVLDSLVFSSTSNNPTNFGSQPARTVTWSVNDGSSTASGMSTVNINPINNAPSLSSVASAVALTQFLSVTLSPALAVSDPDSLTLTGATVKITAGTFPGDGDILSASSVGTNISVSYDGSTETLTLTGTDTLADYQRVLDGVAMSSGSDPTHGGANRSRTVTWQVNDGSASNGLSSPVTTTVIILNAPPPAATTADMILRDGSGDYEIYDIGANSILAAYSLGQVGAQWQFAGLGGFLGSDTTDMMLRNSGSGGFEVYDISNNNITGAAFMGTVGLNWQVMGFGNFSSRGETDMILRNSNTGGVEVYDLANNQITGANFMGTVGLDWQFSGIGNFSGRGTSDMLLRNANTGGLEVYDIDSNQITGAAFVGTVGLDWQFSGVGNFSGVPGETDLLLRNNKSGGLELYDINGNQLTGAAFIGTVGLDWQFAGIAPIHAPGASDLVLRNASTGQFEVYDIANNQLTGAASLGSVGLNLAARWFRVRSPDHIHGQLGLDASARASDGGFWRRQRRSRRLECRLPRCRHIPAAVADDAAARVSYRFTLRGRGRLLPFLACQQFVAHPLRIHSGPPPAAVRECANSLITEEPRDLRDRKVGLTETVPRKIGAELIENFTKAEAFRSQPPRQSPAAHAKRLRNSVEPRLAMRQEWSDRVFDRGS